MNPINAIANSTSFQALQFNMESNLQLLIQRATSPLLKVFDKIAETVIAKHMTSEDSSVDRILIDLSDAFSEPISKSTIVNLYDKMSVHSTSMTKSIKSFHFVQFYRVEPIALENILFDILVAQRYLLLWSKHCEDQSFEAESDILNIDGWDNAQSTKDMRKEALKSLMYEFIELCLFETKMKFIQRTGLFYAQTGSIYEADQFVLQQQAIVEQSIRNVIQQMCVRTFQMASMVPFRKITTSTGAMQDFCHQQKRQFASLLGQLQNQNSSTNHYSSSSSSSSASSFDQAQKQILKELLDESKLTRSETICALNGINTSVEYVQTQLKDSTKLLQKSLDVQNKHCNNVAEELHSLLQCAERLPTHSQNLQMLQQQQQQQQQNLQMLQQPAIVYVSNANNPREQMGEPDVELYGYKNEQKQNR